MAPEEIRDPQLRALQQKYRNELKIIPHVLASRNLPFHFYFSRQLDLEEIAEKRADQRSIQFALYQGRLVLKITGNYFVSYSDELLKPEERARLTYETVILPLLEGAVHALEKTDVPEAFAFEISHHVRKKVLGVSSEGAENVVVVLPRKAAQRIVASDDPGVREAALFEGETFLNAVPVSFWRERKEEPAPETDAPRKAPVAATPPPTAPPAPTVSARVMNGFEFPVVGNSFVAEPIGRQREQIEPSAKVPALSESPAKLSDPPAPPAAPKPQEPQPASPASVKDLQQTYQPALDGMLKELESQAHFVGYAPPAFIPFHSGPYLQLSVTTTLPQAAAGSQYRLAAMAFDQHIAHLIRPVLAYFKDSADFDGIDFSTTAKAGSADSNSVGVEFIFPLKLLSAYANFDCTGQQLIDASFVLINGERVSLNLLVAEAGAPFQ